MKNHNTHSPRANNQNIHNQNKIDQMTILITGGAGYVGTLLIENFLPKSEVVQIVVIDKDPIDQKFLKSPKIKFVQKKLYENWEADIETFHPNVVIHTAWQIRELYGQKNEQHKLNIVSTQKVVNYAFSKPSVQKLVHFSTVASYSARKSNTFDHMFTESDPLRNSEYLYADEKKQAEKILTDLHENTTGVKPQIFVVRPASITGPRGRSMNNRFGLQTSLSGKLKDSKSWWYRQIDKLTKFTPVTKTWARQFVHEDDVVAVVELLTTHKIEEKFEIFNLAPPGKFVSGKDMAKLVSKKSVNLHPRFVQFIFFLMWHLSRGKVPTSRGGWRTYSYPIVVDGSKITEKYGYRYQYGSKDAFLN